MKRRLLALATALALLLGTGCASLLDREYVHVTPHNTTPTAEGDPSILRAESYQELVNALVYFITQGMETGSIRLYTDSEEVEADLENACLEVVQEDALGAYAVEFIKYSVNSVVTYHQADVQITYRRTKEQVASIVSATGTTAIRSELESALATFATERALRISYFSEDESYILDLMQDAYYANPSSALGIPQAEISIYPDSGRQRIVEILLSYPLELQALERRRDVLELEGDHLAQRLTQTGDPLILAAAQSVLDAGGYDREGGSTAYHALLGGGANSEGLALAMSLLCQARGLECILVRGELDGVPHFWNVVNSQNGWRHLDLTVFSGQEEPLRADWQLEDGGYTWNTSAVPQCGQRPEEQSIQESPLPPAADTAER